MSLKTSLALVFALGAGAPRAQAPEVDVSSLYDLSLEGSSARLQLPQKGLLVLTIHTRPGAHISDEAPLKLELSGTGTLTPDKAVLARTDSVGKKAAGDAYPTPRFEVPFTVSGAGASQLHAKLTFFVCTAKLCVRQQKALSLAVQASP